MSIASLESIVEKKDHYYLQKAMKEALKNEKLDLCMLMKDLYATTYVTVVDILERNAQHSNSMVRATQPAIQLELAEGDVEALSPTLTVTELLERLCISVKWDDTYLLETMVGCLPEEAGTLAMSLLEQYNLYLDVYDDLVRVQDSLKVEAALEVTEAQTRVEVTVAKDLSEFTRKDCKEMLDLLLCQSLRIPRNRIMVTEARSGDNTIVFIIAKAFTQSIIQYSGERSALWSFKELGVTRVRIPGLFEVNVSQLLTQHFKETLCSGLTGSMDFVGATKVCVVAELLVFLLASLLMHRLVPLVLIVLDNESLDAALAL